MRYCLVVCFLLTALLNARAQDTVMVLPLSTVRAAYPDLRKEQMTLHTASMRSSSLASLLFAEIGVNVRSNSAQGLSTLNYRGFGGEQTRVSWNGIPLNSTMNGSIDLSLIPVFFMDNAALTATAGTSRFNNPVGGELQLSSGVPGDQRNGWTIRPGMGTGSFDQHMGGVDVTFRSENFASRSRMFLSSASNNYPYYRFGRPDNDLVRLEHAAVKGMGLLQDLEAGNNKISLWMQDFRREIPATAVETFSDKTQQDRHIRIAVQRSDSNKLGTLSSLIGFTAEELIYTDPTSGIYSENRAIGTMASVQQRTGLNHVILVSGLDVQVNGARTTNYRSIDPIALYTLRQTAEFGSGKWAFEPGISLASKMGERINLLPSATTTYRWNTAVSSSLSYARGIRFPSMNHLYWEPGGDPGVGPETSDNLSVKTVLLKKKVKTVLVVFGSLIQDQILWLPDESGVFRVTQDKGRVAGNFGSSVNFQGFANLVWVSGMRLVWSANYHFTRSARDMESPDVQNILIPVHQAGGRAGLLYRSFYLGWTQTFVSRRYTTTTNSDWLSDYTLTDLVASFSKPGWNINVRVNNLFGQYYEMLPLRPMPMRSVQINLLFMIKHYK